MINEFNLRKYCCEDISLIENYNEAVNDTTQIWDCHHRKEIELNKNRQELIDMGLYYNRPASELIFLTHSEHTSLHTKGHKYHLGKCHSEEFKHERSEAYKGVPKPKYKWETPYGEIKEMTKANVTKWHPDWILIGEV